MKNMTTIDPLKSTCICNTTIKYLTKNCYEPDLENCTHCNPLLCHKVFKHTMRCKKYTDCSSAYIPTPKPAPTPTEPNPTHINPTDIPPNGHKKETIITLSILLPIVVIVSISIGIWIKKRARGLQEEALPLANLQQQDDYGSIII